MPRGDGRGPLGGQAGSGGMGRGRGRGQGGAGMGQGGFCVCPQCGKKIPHSQGVPCNSISCPSCNINMVRI
jgi:hypothetical protein